MKQNPNNKQEERNQRIYKLYKKGAYTMRGIGKLFRLSAPRIFAIIKKCEIEENFTKEKESIKGRPAQSG